MIGSEKIWTTCQSESLAITDVSLCALRFPKCKGCPLTGASRHTMTGSEDPMKSSIVRGWLNGLRGVA